MEPEPGKIQFRSFKGEPTLPYYLYVPRRPGAERRVLVAVHGISRNAEEVANAFAPMAERFGVALVAPLFVQAHFHDYQRLGRRGRGARADRALLHVLEQVGELTGFRIDKVYMYGNSGGAQFVHRFVMAHPDVVLRYAISGAGWYTMPDAAEPFPYGLRPIDALSDLTFDADRFLKVPGCVLVGEYDTVRDHSLNRSSRIDATQGRNRVERATAWAAAMRTAARWRGLKTAFPLHVLENAGHDFTELVDWGGLVDVVARCLFEETPRGNQTAQP